MTKTYEEIKSFLADCGIDIEIHPKQKLWVNGYPYWHCTNWEEIKEATSHCSVPAILGTSHCGNGEFSVDIYDKFIWDNDDYRSRCRTPL